MASINAESEDLDALTRDDAADSTPGVSQVRQSFQIIFLLYGLVIPCVTGLFFLIITFQKSGALTLLRAIGAPAGGSSARCSSRRSSSSVPASPIGLALYTPVSQQRLGGIPLRFETDAVVFWAVAPDGARRGKLPGRGSSGAGDRSDRGDHRRGQPMKLALRS